MKKMWQLALVTLKGFEKYFELKIKNHSNVQNRKK